MTYEKQASKERKSPVLYKSIHGGPIYADRNQVIAEVTSLKGTCHTEHKVGEEFLFALTGPTPPMCFGAIGPLIPFVRVLQLNGRLQASEDPDGCIDVSCLDATNALIVKLRRGHREPRYPTAEYLKTPWILTPENRDNASRYPKKEDWEHEGPGRPI